MIQLDIVQYLLFCAPLEFLSIINTECAERMSAKIGYNSPWDMVRMSEGNLQMSRLVCMVFLKTDEEFKNMVLHADLQGYCLNNLCQYKAVNFFEALESRTIENFIRHESVSLIQVMDELQHEYMVA